MDFLYNIKLWVNILRATKIDSVFMLLAIKNQVDFYKVQKSSCFLLKSYKNRLGFYGCYKDQVHFCSVQKPSWFLQASYKTKSIFSKQTTITESFF